MRHYHIVRPVGLELPCAEIESVCENAGLRPKHLILPMDSGPDRATLVEYMVDKYKEAGVLDFCSSLDDYIEIVFDGTLSQLRIAFEFIKADYDNEYHGIITMDISEIASHLTETQAEELIKNCKRVCEYAYVVFFVHTVPGRNEEKLLERLCAAIGDDNIKRLTVEPHLLVGGKDSSKPMASGWGYGAGRSEAR